MESMMMNRLFGHYRRVMLGTVLLCAVATPLWAGVDANDSADIPEISYCVSESCTTPTMEFSGTTEITGDAALRHDDPSIGRANLLLLHGVVEYTVHYAIAKAGDKPGTLLVWLNPTDHTALPQPGPVSVLSANGSAFDDLIEQLILAYRNTGIVFQPTYRVAETRGDSETEDATIVTSKNSGPLFAVIPQTASLGLLGLAGLCLMKRKTWSVTKSERLR